MTGIPEDDYFIASGIYGAGDKGNSDDHPPTYEEDPSFYDEAPRTSNRNDIIDLRHEAAAAGDREQVALCDQALNVNGPHRTSEEIETAWDECERVIAAARHPRKRGHGNDATRLRSADGHPALDFTRLDGQDALRFLMRIAALRLDNEGTTADGRAYAVENDHAWETYNDLVTEARALLGWETGKPPLDRPEYLECAEEDDDDRPGTR